MKNLIFAVILATLGGCAAIQGQKAYEGPVASTPEMGFVTNRTVDPCGPHGNERCVVAHTAGYVTNPGVYPIRVTIDCDDLSTRYADVLVPARTTQFFLVGSGTRSCWVADREIVKP